MEDLVQTTNSCEGNSYGIYAGPSTVFQRRLNSILDVFIGLSLLAQVGMMFASIMSGWLFSYQLSWSEEPATITLVMIAFVGGAVAYSRGEHMAVETVIQRLPNNLRGLMAAAVDWLILLTSVLTGYLSLPQLLTSASYASPMLGINGVYFYFPLPLGLILMAVIAIQKLWIKPRRPVILTGVIIVVLLGLFVAGRDLWGPWGLGPFVTWGTFGVFVVLLAIGIPIAFVLAIDSLFFLYASGQAPVLAVPGAMFTGMQNYVLVAIPIFVYAGYIMTGGGLSRRLAEAVIAVIGRLRGGLLQVMIVSIYIVSGISGSKVADVAAVGSAMDGMLRRNKYDMNESAAVLAASAVMGETVPPSTPMLVLGSITSISVASLFMAGFLPAAVIMVILMTLVYYRAKKLGLQPGSKIPLGTAIRIFLSGIPSMFVPVLLIGGILLGIATPTQVSSIAVVYALALAILFYREMDARVFLRSLVDATTKAGMILFIIATASAFSWALAVVQLPNKIEHVLALLGTSPWLFMVGTVLTLIMTGAVLEGMPAIIIFGPMLLPIAIQFGVNPLHYAIVLIMAMGLGTFMPPVGIGAYVTCSITKTSMEGMSRQLVPYLVVLFLGIIAVSFIPWITLIFPKLLHMH